MNLPECFCQDLVEEYFGIQQRKFARRNDSMTFTHLATITTLFAFNRQYLVRVEILEEEKTRASQLDGSYRLSIAIPKLRKVKKINRCFVFQQKRNACFLLLVAM